MAKAKKTSKAEASDSSDDSKEVKQAETPAKIVEILGRTGVRGEVTQIRCEVMSGRDEGKILVRNTRGPVKEGDILMLQDTVMQAAKIEAR